MGYLEASGFPGVVNYILMQKAQENFSIPWRQIYHRQNGAFYTGDYEKTFQFSSCSVQITHYCTHAPSSFPKSANGGCKNSRFLLHLSASCEYSQPGLLALASPTTAPGYYRSLIPVSQHSPTWLWDCHLLHRGSERRIYPQIFFWFRFINQMHSGTLHKPLPKKITSEKCILFLLEIYSYGLWPAGSVGGMCPGEHRQWIPALPQPAYRGCTWGETSSFWVCCPLGRGLGRASQSTLNIHGVT